MHVISIVAEKNYSFKKGLSQFSVLESLRTFPEIGILLLMHCEFQLRMLRVALNQFIPC